MQAASLPIILYTDHKALLSIIQGETTSVRIAGWQLRLGKYNLDIVHVKGTENGLADGLSRMPIRALDVGIIGKEQSYLSVMTISQDDTGRGFVLKEKSGLKGKQENRRTVQKIIGIRGRRSKTDGDSSCLEREKEADPEELKERWSTWLGEEWYKEVV